MWTPGCKALNLRSIANGAESDRRKPTPDVFVRLALITPFSPEIGGGAAQLRSHLRHLPSLDLEWCYLAPREVSCREARSRWLGPCFTPGELLSDLSARTGFLPGSRKRA